MSHDPAKFELVSEPPAALEKGQVGVVGSGALFGWAHWLWIVPLAVFCSPVGLIITLKLAPAYWPAPACGMAVALAGCAYPARDE